MPVQIVPIAQIAPEAVEHLLDRAFGADRRGRTAYRVRGYASAIDELSFAAIDDDRLLGTVQCWPIAFTGDHSETIPMIMLGPVAVEPALQRGGIGIALMRRALAAADARPRHDPLMLIGDPEYYSRFFGFSAAKTGEWRLPGPVERHRLLARGDAVPDGPGALGPKLPVLA